MRMISIAALAAVVVWASPAQAEWVGKGELGGVLARGNTEAETVNARLDMSRELDRWKHGAGFSMLRTSNDGLTAADRFELRGESNYKLTDRSYLFGALRYENDKFTDYSYQATASAGYGYKFVDTESTKFDGKIGVGFRQSELRLTGDQSDQAIMRGALNFERRLTDTTLVANRFLIESGSDNTFMQNELALEVKMNSSLALGLTYAIRHNTDVQPLTEKTDQVLTANLVFGF